MKHFRLPVLSSPQVTISQSISVFLRDSMNLSSSEPWKNSSSLIMLPISFSSSLPISSCCEHLHQAFFFEPSRQEEKNPTTYRAQRSNPSQLATVALSLTRTAQPYRFLFLRTNCRLPIAESLDLAEKDCNFVEFLTIFDYNDILAALAKAGETESAIIIFSGLHATRGLSPDRRSFSIVIDCLCKKDKPDEARRVLDDMVQSGFHPDVVIFTAVVNCLCKRGKLKQAYEVFDVMRRVGCEPNIRTYNCLIHGLCYVGRVEEALELLNKIRKSPITPDIYTFTSVMDGFCKVGRSDEAMELMKEAEQMGLAPTVVTYNTLLNGYCKEGRPLEGLLVLKEMEAGNYGPDLISYSTILTGLLKWSKVSAALEIYKKMNVYGLQVEEGVMNKLLRGLCRKPSSDKMMVDEAKMLHDKILEMGYVASTCTCCLMVQALARGGEIDGSLDYLLEMLRRGDSPTLLTYNVVLRILCRDGRVDDAMRVLVLMIRRETIPSRFSFTILLDKLNQQKRLLDALGIYAAAVKRGLKLHRTPRNDWKDEKEFLAQR